jgi:hypothetical protein
MSGYRGLHRPATGGGNMSTRTIAIAALVIAIILLIIFLV